MDNEGRAILEGDRRMTEKLRELLKDVQTVYEGKGMIVHPNSFDKLRMEVIKLDNINKQQSEQIEKMKCCGNCAKYKSGYRENPCKLTSSGICGEWETSIGKW